MLISFDFDDTLDRSDAQLIAKQLIANGHEVIIVTSRFSDEKAGQKHGQLGHGWNQDLRIVADNVSIGLIETIKHVYLTGTVLIFILMITQMSYQR
jgi:hypothetical protein